MKAVLLKKPPASGTIGAEVSEVLVPDIGAGELLVEMKACGLCGTDIEKARGEYTAALPILGHEAVGFVASVGEGVIGIRKGDRVFPHHHVPCHECFYCLHGNETACKKYRSSNIYPGGFSEFFRVPAWNVSKGGVLQLPSNLGFEELSLIEPVGCCIRALDRCRVGLEDSVLVVGAGPIGILHSILLLSKRARVIISDVSETRLRFAEKMKIERVVDAGKRDVASEVRELTAGRGADVVIVASGSPKAILQALGSVRAGGKVCLFGVPGRGSVLDYDVGDLYNAEVSLIPSYGATDSETAAALSLIDTNSEWFRPIITHGFPIEEFDKAVETATSGAGMKVIITH
ncbi:MAG: alcohol dehydrogenase catalytic domain-containing protein [Nitrososphaerales archaeon]